VEEIPSLSNKRKAIRGKPIKVSVVFYPFIKRRRRQEEKKKKIRLLLRSRSGPKSKSEASMKDQALVH